MTGHDWSFSSSDSMAKSSFTSLTMQKQLLMNLSEPFLWIKITENVPLMKWNVIYGSNYLNMRLCQEWISFFPYNCCHGNGCCSIVTNNKYAFFKLNVLFLQTGAHNPFQSIQQGIKQSQNKLAHSLRNKPRTK